MKRSLVLAAMIGGCGAADKTVESDEEADYRADVGDGDGTEEDAGDPRREQHQRHHEPAVVRHRGRHPSPRRPLQE